MDKERKGKEKIRAWDRIGAKLKGKFLLVDYLLNLSRQLQNLREKKMSMKETEEFNQFSIKTRQSDEGDEVVARYINGL